MTKRSWYMDEDDDVKSSTVIQETALYEGPCDEADVSGDAGPADEGPGDGDPGDADPGDTDPAGHFAPDTGGIPQDNGFTAYSTGEAALRNGEIGVTATESGLLLALRVAPEQLRRNPEDLAEDLLRLCRLAANRAGLARRAELSRLGLTVQALDLLGLPTQDAVERTELSDESNHEYEPRTWLEREESV